MSGPLPIGIRKKRRVHTDVVNFIALHHHPEHAGPGIHDV